MKGLIYISMALVLFFSGCAHVEKAKEQPKIIPPVEISSPVMPQMEKAKKIEILGPKELFSFSLREAEVKDILRAISKQSNYNVIIEPDVNGQCTVDLKNVTLQKALEYILEPLNYHFKIEGNTIYVSKPKIETRVFPLNYISLKKIGSSTVTGSSTGNTGSSGNTGTTSGTTGTGGTSSTGSALINLQTLTEADLWHNIEDNIKKLISKDGNYTINKHASLVMVMDYPKNINNVAMFLEAVDGTVQRQVMIEAKIVEINLTEETQEGINWSVINSKVLGGDYLVNLEQALVSPQTTYFNIPFISDAAKMPTAPSQYFRFGVSSGSFNSFIDLLKETNEINLISSPRISTLNNQRAVIKVARDEVYFDYSSTSSTSTTTSGYTTKFITVGLILDVTPQIDNQGNIIMNVHPVLTEKIGEVQMPVSGTQSSTTKAYVPVLAVREVDTVVRVREGEMVIIGGLLQDKSSQDDAGINGLMDIPFLGKLFKQSTKKKNKTELVIFLIPKVIYGKN